MERKPPPHPLRRYRLDNGLSLDELALKSRTSKATLSRIETGLQTPSLSLIRRISTATDGALTANDFMGAAPAEMRVAS